MKKLVLLSHCILNSYCELPQAPDDLRKEILDILQARGISILQLPCPELTYQGLERQSIYPGNDAAEAYEDYCRELLQPVMKNLKEYASHDIEIAGIIGIDTSPSCSVADEEAFMMKLLIRELEQENVPAGSLLDMPVSGDGKAFLEKLKAL